MLGVFTATEETTARVVGERRLRTLRELSACLSRVEDVAQVGRVAAETLGRNRHDVPFMALYAVEPRERLMRLQSYFAVTPGRTSHDTWPPEKPIDDPSCRGAEALASQQMMVVPVTDEYAKSIGAVPPWNDTPRDMAIIPLRSLEKAGDCAQGLLVVGLNTHRALDDNYRTFLSLCGTQISSSLSNARAFEEEKRRAQALAELDRSKTLFFSNISCAARSHAPPHAC